jgi:aspartate/methionine/tyrosine aminotransferase
VSQEVATAFMAEIVKLCRVHGVWLAHEDAYGGFMVQRENTEAWLMRGFGA